MPATISPATPRTRPAAEVPARRVPPLWAGFVVASLLALDVLDQTVWSIAVPLTAGALWLGSTGWWQSPSMTRPGALDRRDLAVMAALYLAVVGLFRLAFVVFTTDRLLGLFLSFAGGLVLGVAGPVLYTVWLRRRPLRSLGLGTHRLQPTLALGLLFAGVQALIMLWGYRLPAPEDWVPLLVMSLTVGLFEAVFFRGFVQGRLQANLGTGPAVAGAAALYALYHVGYGMGAGELGFLFALGVVYAVAYRLVENVLVLWPLLTPLGAWFNNLEAGDIDLPWASILGSPTCWGSWRWSSGWRTGTSIAGPAAHDGGNLDPPPYRTETFVPSGSAVCRHRRERVAGRTLLAGPLSPDDRLIRASHGSPEDREQLTPSWALCRSS